MHVSSETVHFEMTENKMEWGPDEIIKFIRKIEQYNLLWDAQSPNYKNTSQKRDVYNELGKEFGCDGIEAERKWKILRGQYRREQHKMRTNASSGLSWFGYPYMKFISGQNNEARCENATHISDMESVSSFAKAIIKVEDEQTNWINFDESTDNSTDEVRSQRSCKRKFLNDERGLLKDEFDTYADCLAAKLRQIKKKNNLLSVQRRIDNLLYDVLLSECDEVYI